MANTTETYWDVDGVSLQTYARNIETVGGGKAAPPPTRGEDITVPYRRGQRFVQKQVDSRILPLEMWVRGTDADGIAPSTGLARRQLFDENWRQLRSLLFQEGREFTLRKRFYVDGVMRSAVARASFNGGLEPTMIGRQGAKFPVDLKLADPYFYDENYTRVNLASGAQAVTIPGDVSTTRILANISGARSKPRIRNTTLGVEVQYLDDVNAGDQLQLDIDAYRAMFTPSGGAQGKRNTRVNHAGAPEWLRLQQGANSITLTATGAGAVSLDYKAAWI